MVRQRTGGPPQTVKVVTSTENPQPAARPAHGQGDHFGRSPDLRVNAWLDLPITPVRNSGNTSFARRLQLRGQSWIWSCPVSGILPNHIPFSPDGETARTEVGT